jgi:hypothetical protein
MTLTVSENFSSPAPAESPSRLLTPDVLEAFNEDRQIKALVGWALSQYEKMKSERQRFERQWAINLSFVAGRQNVQFFGGKTNQAGRLVTPPVPSYVTRRVINRIRPIMRTEMARVMSNKPNASVVPASSEDEDLFAAQAGEQIWESIYAGKKLLKNFSRSAFWLVCCGVGYTKIWWDPQGYDDLTKMPGTIQYAPVSPFHIYVPDLMEPEIENQSYVFNVFTKSVEWVKSTYGIPATPTTQSVNDPMENAQFVYGTNQAVADSCLVIEAWFKPNGHPLFPKGGYLTIIDDRVVDIRLDPFYEHKQYPFVKWENIPTGSFYPESVITDLLDPQREYNRTRNQLTEAKNRMSKPQLLAPKGSIQASRISSEPGQIIEYMPGLAPPQPLQLQGIPNYVLQELDNLLADMEDISSQHAVSRGGTTSGVTAATAINFMQERDDALMTTTYQSIEDGWEKIAKQTLSHVVQFWNTKRTVSVTGVDGSFDAIALKGTELQKGTDIRMEAGSALPVSKAAKQALLMDIMKFGWIDPIKGLALMEMGGMDKLYDDIKIDEQQAQRENLRMRRLDIQEIQQHLQQAQQTNDQINQMQDQIFSGQSPEVQAQPTALTTGTSVPDVAIPGAETDPNTGAPLQMPANIVPVNSWDNHAIHIETHNRFRKSQAYELLSPEVQQQFEYHVNLHQQAMMPPPGMNPDGTPVDPAAEGMPPEAPVGSNQFGPPGMEAGAPMSEMQGAIPNG